MVDAVLLEWEGVLAGTFVARRDALLRALADEGVAIDETVVMTECRGRTTHAATTMLLARAGHTDPTLVELVALRATRTFAERLGKGFVLLPGARDFIERVQSSAPIGVVTCATRAETEFMLGLAGLDRAVTTIVSADDGVAPPPSSATFDRALENLARRRPVQRERVVALAPTARALRAARAAGVRAIAVCSPAHVALDADGAVESIDGLTVGDLAALSGISMLERR